MSMFPDPEIAITPPDERPYSAAEFYDKSELLSVKDAELIWDYETWHRKYDASEGTDKEAQEEARKAAGLLWSAIYKATMPDRLKEP